MNQCPMRSAVGRLIEDFDHHSPEFAEHRVEFYEELHKQGGVIRSERHGGFLLVGGHANTNCILRNPEIFSNQEMTLPASSFPKIIPAKIDPPEHAEYKKLLTRHFTPQQAEARRPQMRKVLDELLAPLREGKELDVVTEVLQPLVAGMSMDIIGYEAPDITLYTRPIHIASLPDYPHEVRMREMEILVERVRSDVATLKEAKRGLIGALAEETVFGRPLSDEELAMIMVNLLIGSLGTTPLFDGSMTVFLAEHPGHRADLTRDGKLLKPAVLEMLRSFSPVQTFVRTATRDATICGQEIRKGDHLILGYGAANHDASQYPQPEKVDFSRAPRDHMAFGMGPHRCLGSHLATVTAEEYLKALLHIAPDYVLVSRKPFYDIATKLGYLSVRIRAKGEGA